MVCECNNYLCDEWCIYKFRIELSSSQMRNKAVGNSTMEEVRAVCCVRGVEVCDILLCVDVYRRVCMCVSVCSMYVD